MPSLDRADRERRAKLPNYAVQGLLEIVAAADIAREETLAPAIARAEHRFDELMLVYLTGVENRLFKVRDVAKMILEGKSLEQAEYEAEMELQRSEP